MVASSLNLLLLPSLSTTNAFASASASAQSATTMKSIGGQLLSRPRPRRKKMVSIGVEAMRNMIVTDSSSAAVVVSIPASPSKYGHEREQRFNDDDVEGIFRSTTNNRKTILSIPLSAPMMPMMPMMPDLTTPTPTTTRKSSSRRSSASSIVFPRRRVNKTKKTELSNNVQAQLPVLPALQVPTNKMKKAVRQIKKGLFLEFISSKNQHQQQGCCSGRTSTTVSTSTSTSSLKLATPQPQKEESICNEVLTPTIMLKPRIRMFQEEEEQQEQQVTMIKPAAPWSTTQPSSSSFQQKDVTEEVEVTTTTTTKPTPFALSASLNKALSVLSVNSNDDDDAQDDDGDDWGVFVSFGEDDNDHEYNNNNNYDCYSPLDNRSYLPVFTEGHWKQ